MSVFLIIISIVSLSVAVNYFLYALADSKQRDGMKQKEINLKKAGITPYGSTLSHGMYINTKTNKLVADQKESVMWYKRLV
jgi:lipopolysaccharide export LptBFGC system permease protein LptF